MKKTRTLSQASQSSLERQVSKQGHQNNDHPFVIKRVHKGAQYNPKCAAVKTHVFGVRNTGGAILVSVDF